MPTEFDEVIAEASFEDRTILATLLNTTNNDSESLRERLRSKSLTIWQKVSRKEVIYSDLLKKVGAAHGIRSRVWESSGDFERRIVRTFYCRAQNALTPTQRRDYLVAMKGSLQHKPTFGIEAAAAASIVAAQASGFGVYQMATTVMGMASSAASVTIPFLGYMVLTKAIFFAIGPLGWAALGATTLHKLTKPKYAEMVAIVAWMFFVRNQVHPQLTIGNYSVTELIRMLCKLAIPIGLAVALLISANHSSNSLPISIATPVGALSPALQNSVSVSDPRDTAVAKALGSDSLHWKAHFAPGKNYFISGGDDLTGEVILDQLIDKTEEGDIHLVAIRSDPGEEGMNSCHACSILLSAFTFKVIGNRWILLTSNRYLTFGGSLGVPPALSVTKIGQQTFALVSRDFYMHQGYESGSIAFYAISTHSIVKVLEYAIPERLQTDDEQNEGDNTTYDIMPSSKDMFDIQISSGPPGSVFREHCMYKVSRYICSNISDVEHDQGIEQNP
jgi:hypothetical protein